MKKLTFTYEMKLQFSSPVTEHRFQLRCIPATSARQQVIDVAVELNPATKLDTTTDSFDSVVMTGYIPEPHDVFHYKVTGIAFVDNEHIKSEVYKPLYRFATELTTVGPAVAQLAAKCRESLAAAPEAKTTLEQAQVIMHEVYAAFTYTPGATTINTTAEQALTLGKGVCQDYAHVMLAVCRELGLPARYIAGLLHGEGATHAWVEVYQNQRWIGLDPTHDCLVNDNYITIAHGRDYRDCMVDIGLFNGNQVQQTQWVNATVKEFRS